jgi:lysyl-tRNA synthetase class 2
LFRKLLIVSLNLEFYISTKESAMQLSEQEIIRRESLEKLRELGINPYPAKEFKSSASVAEVLSDFEKLEGSEVVLAGRMMNRRIMGSASFAELKDSTGRMQIYLNRDELAPGEDKTIYNTVFKKTPRYRRYYRCQRNCI